MWVAKNPDGTLLKATHLGDTRTPFFISEELGRDFFIQANQKGGPLIIDLVPIVVDNPPEDGILVIHSEGSKFQWVELRPFLQKLQQVMK